MTLADADLTLGVAKKTLSNLELGKPSVGLGLALKIAAGLWVVLFMVPARAREQTKMRLMNIVKRIDILIDGRLISMHSHDSQTNRISFIKTGFKVITLKGLKA